MAMLTLPAPETLPHPDDLWSFSCWGQMPTVEFIDRLRARATAVIDRAYGPPPPTRHGFYDPAGFVATSRMLNARKRVRSLLVARAVQRALRRGEIVTDGFNRHGNVKVRLPSDPPPQPSTMGAAL